MSSREHTVESIPNFYIAIENLSKEDAKRLSAAGVRWNDGELVEDFLATVNALPKGSLVGYCIRCWEGLFVIAHVSEKSILRAPDINSIDKLEIFNNPVPACLR